MAKLEDVKIVEAVCPCGWRAPVSVSKLQVGVITVRCPRCKKKSARAAP